MRIVRRVDELVLELHRSDQIDDVLPLGRDLERLAAHPDVLREILAGQPLEPWNLAAQSLELGVEAPQQAWNPGRAAFDQDQPQSWVFLEHSMRDEADQVGLDRLGPQDVSLEIRVDAAATRAGRVGPPSGATVDRDRPPGLFGSGVDGMEDRMAKAVVERVVDEHDLDHPRVRGMPSNLSGGQVGQLARDHDRGQKARILRQPAIDAPVVASARQLACEIGVVMAREVAVVAEGEDRTPDVAWVKELCSHGRVVGARLAATLRVSVGSHEPVRIGKPILHSQRHVARATAIRYVLPPPARQVWDQLGVGAPSMVNVAVNDGSRVHRLSLVSLTWDGRTGANPPLSSKSYFSDSTLSAPT